MSNDCLIVFSELSQSQYVGEEQGGNMFVDMEEEETTFITPPEKTLLSIREGGAF